MTDVADRATRRRLWTFYRRRSNGTGAEVVELDDWTYWRRPTKAVPVAPEPEKKPERQWDNMPSRLGRFRADGGRAAVGFSPTIFRGTSAQVAGAFPWVTPRSLPAVGVPIGQDVHTRNAFSCHFAEWTSRKITTNPNAIFTGIPGAGKSALLKALIFRFAAFGVLSLILGDIKGEYNALARYLGVEPPILGPGSHHRLNPLDGGPLAANLPSDPKERLWRLNAIHARRLTLMMTLMEYRLGRSVTSGEEKALGLALRRTEAFERDRTGNVRDPLIAEVLREVWGLDSDDAYELHVVGGADELRRQMHEAGSALETLLDGPLAGLFDGPSTYQVDFTKPIQTVDIHLIEGLGEGPTALALACLSSWGQAAVDDPNRREDDLRLVVRDECWRQMRYPALVQKLDADLRLSRAKGCMQILATHRFADFEAAANAVVAKDLVGSCATKVFLAQDVGPLAVVGERVGLTEEEKEQIGSWVDVAVGKALWRVGNGRGFVVQGSLSPLEKRLFYTDEKMGS